jgi:hypothetical protein
LKEFTSTVDRLIFETRSKNLAKLGTEPVMSVVTDFPVEFMRMIIKALHQYFDMAPDVGQDAIRKMAETITGGSLSHTNPWLDINNENKIMFTDKTTKHEIEIELSFIGNEALWGIKISYERTLEKRRTIPIKIGNQSANELLEKFMARVKQVVTDLKPRWPRTPENVEALERSEKGLKKEDPELVAQLQPFFKAHFMYFGLERGEKRGVDRFFVRFSFAKYGIGDWNTRQTTALRWGDINKRWDMSGEPLRKFEYTFQFDILEKLMPLLWKKFRENNIIVQNGGFNGDYLWFETFKGSREAKHPSYGKKDSGGWYSYDEVERAIEDRIRGSITAEREKNAKPMTLQGFKRFIVKNALGDQKEED